MIRAILSFAAIYLAAVGLALLLVPAQFAIGALPPDPPLSLIALLRLFGGPLLGIAILDWQCRNLRPELLAPVLLSNLVGFGLVAANDIWGIASGEAREITRYFLIIHLGFAIAFAIALDRTRRPKLW